jgi:polysaccharide pyruvyl transferase WcaK-like protein
MKFLKSYKKIILLGAYGQNNLGDEAMMETVLSVLIGRDVQVFVNVADESNVVKMPGVEYFHTSLKKDFFRKIWLFLSCDVVVYGGGSLFVELKMVDLNKRMPLFRMFLINMFAKFTGKQVAYLGVGAERVSPGLSEWLFKKAARMSGLCCVRDQESLVVMRDYGVMHAKLGADIVFSNTLPPNQNKSKKFA